MSVINKVLFPKTAWLLLLLIPVTFFGFYPGYFSRLFDDMPSLFHVHAFFMLWWVAMAITQPILIMRKKTKLHKLIGKISYVVMPIVFITAYLIIRYAYLEDITEEKANVAKGISKLSDGEISAKAAAGNIIGPVYLLWLVVYYLLAVINRKKILFHATYMFAAILTLLGPTVDRILYNVFTKMGWPVSFFVENFVFILNTALLGSLLIYQWRKGNSIKPSVIALGIYIAGLLFFFLLPNTRFWQVFYELIT